MPQITSRQHPLVRAFKMALRGAAEHVVLDGWHLLHEAVDAGVEITTVAVAGDPPTAHDRAALQRVAAQAEVVTVTRAVMDAISPVRTPTGVVALAVPKRRDFRELLSPAPALVLVAADVQDPGNAGAVVRSAEAGGATGVLFTGASADPWGWKALRASMGSTCRLPVVKQSETANACDELQRQGLRVCAAIPRGGTPMYEIDLATPVALLLGSEGAGLDRVLIDTADERLSIPMASPVESLNLAVAAALLLYEARRQRRARR